MPVWPLETALNESDAGSTSNVGHSVPVEAFRQRETGSVFCEKGSIFCFLESDSVQTARLSENQDASRLGSSSELGRAYMELLLECPSEINRFAISELHGDSFDRKVRRYQTVGGQRQTFLLCIFPYTHSGVTLEKACSVRRGNVQLQFSASIFEVPLDTSDFDVD
jgi:hypothetical protein